MSFGAIAQRAAPRPVSVALLSVQGDEDLELADVSVQPLVERCDIEPFFSAQAAEEALRKDRDCPVETETPKRKGTSGREEAQPPPPDVNFSLIFQQNLQTSQGSFSSVSTPNFASKYSLEST